MKNCFGYEDGITYPIEPNLWDSLSFFIMQITPALSYNDLYNMPEDTFFAYYQLSMEKHEAELEALNDDKDKDKDFIGEEDEDAVDFFEEITGYND
mgnify:CR=1 FL=1